MVVNGKPLSPQRNRPDRYHIFRGSNFFVNDVFSFFKGGCRLSNESDSFFPQRGLWALGPQTPDSRLIHRPPKIPTVLIRCLGRECLMHHSWYCAGHAI